MEDQLAVNVVSMTACGINAIALIYLVALLVMNWNSGEPEESVGEFRKGLRYLSFFFLGLVILSGVLGFVLGVEIFSYVAVGCLLGMPVYAIISRVGRMILFTVGGSRTGR